MSYTITIFRRDRTDKAPTTVRLPRAIFWLLIGGLIVLPIILFYLTVMVLAPQYAGDQVASLRSDAGKLKELRLEHAQVVKLNAELQERIAKLQQEQGEATARLTIAESARHEAMQRMQKLTEEHSRMQKNLEFYKAFMKPATEREEIQCYNIEAKPGSSTLSYGVSFIRTNPNVTERFEGRAKIRILAGGEVLQLAKTDASSADASHKLGFVKDYRINGRLNVKVPSTGLRMLDVKAYDEEGTVVAHCWKAF